MSTEIQLTTREELYGTDDQGVQVINCDDRLMLTSKDSETVKSKPAIGKCKLWGNVLIGSGGICLFDGCAKNLAPVRIRRLGKEVAFIPGR